MRRQTQGKDAVKHSHSAVAVIGNGSTVSADNIYLTGGGNRSVDGSPKVIQQGANTGATCSVSDVIKYVNIILQGAMSATGVSSNTQGWIEYAVVFRQEIFVAIPTTNLGTKTLGDIASQMFRGDCLWTGQFPISVNQPNVQEVKIKLPKKCNKVHLGDNLILYSIFRDAVITDLQTDTVKLIKSYHFKVYS